jgi:hypothetical protein
MANAGVDAGAKMLGVVPCPSTAVTKAGRLTTKSADECGSLQHAGNITVGPAPRHRIGLALLSSLQP